MAHFKSLVTLFLYLQKYVDRTLTEADEQLMIIVVLKTDQKSGTSDYTVGLK